jgi:hypothetical protein
MHMGCSFLNVSSDMDEEYFDISIQEIEYLQFVERVSSVFVKVNDVHPRSDLCKPLSTKYRIQLGEIDICCLSFIYYEFI